MEMLGLVLRLVCSLALVLGLLLLIARFAGRRFQGRAGAPVQVVHRQPISRGSSVTVVTVGTRVLVLGSTEHQVTLLTELEPDELELPLPTTVDTTVDMTAGDAVGDAADRADQAPARRLASLGEGRHRAAAASDAATGPLAGSVLSAQTWKQALAAATRAQTGASARLDPTKQQAS
jgi:flagellar protein FliO/FliZ